MDGLISRLDAVEVAQQKMLTEPSPSSFSLPVEHPLSVDPPSLSSNCSSEDLDPQHSDLGSLLSESGM